MMHSSRYFGLAAMAGVLACAAAIAVEWRVICAARAGCARCRMTSLIAAKLSAISCARLFQCLDVIAPLRSSRCRTSA